MRIGNDRMIPAHRFRRMLAFLGLLTLTVFAPGLIRSQGGELVASMEVRQGLVQVKRAGVADWTAVRRESLVGVGDSIRTDATGLARITFFASGTDTDILPNSEFRIDEFSGVDETQFKLSVTVLLGQTLQRIGALLDNGSSYRINSTGIEMAVRGTVMAVRVEPGGRSATIVQEGLVRTTGTGDRAAGADVSAGFGVRGERDSGLSEVVKATTFAQLDSALDGCTGLIDTLGDVVLNVRTGPNLRFPRIAQLDNRTLHRLVGVTATTKWYRLPFQGGFAWVYAPAVKLDDACAGLREFSDDFGPEDTSRYEGLPPGVDLISTSTPVPTATAP